MEKVFDISKPVTGTYFIGRREEYDFIRKNVFDAAARGESYNLSVTGMNRIGKTSLLRKICKEFREEGHHGVYVVESSLQGYEGFWSFMLSEVLGPLAKQLDMEALMEEDPIYGEDLQECLDYYQDRDTLNKLFQNDIWENNVGKGKLKDLFTILADFGKHVVWVMDEFDYATEIFGSQRENFAWLRNLLQSCEGISPITLSRRSIYYIETNSFGGSTLSGIFDKRGLYGFKNSEIDAYFALLKEQGCELSEKQKGDIVYYCGRSPYYLAIMGQAFLEHVLDTTEDIGAIFSMKGKNYYDSFDNIVRLLEQEKMLKAMLQMFVGPVYDLQKSDIDRLIGMGYCMSQSGLESRNDRDEYADYLTGKVDREYFTVCDKFVDYLAEIKHGDVENIWPALSHTERLMRKVIETEGKKQFGSQWSVAIDAQVDKVLGGAEEKQRVQRFYNDYKKKYGKLSEQEKSELGCSKIQVINFQTLFKVMDADWSRYQKYFLTDAVKADKSKLNAFREELGAQFKLLNSARNPVAHNNVELLREKEVERVNQICENLCKVAEKALQE